MKNSKSTIWFGLASISLALSACKKDNSGDLTGQSEKTLPGQSTAITFYVAKGEALAFAMK